MPPVQALHQKKKKNYILSWVSLMLGVIPLGVAADELDTLQFNASLNKTYDNNIFRQSNNEISDQITVASVGAKLDKAYSLQRFKIDINYLDYKYRQSDFLDYHATNYNAAWLWSLTPNLTGVLSSERAQTLNDFRDFRNPIQNIRTSKINRFRAEYSPHHVWALIGGVTESEFTNSQQFNAQANYDALAVDYGARYFFASGTNVSLLGHRRRGEYQNRPLNPVLQFDNGFVEYEYEVDVVFKATGKTNLSAKLGHLEREYDNFSERDYQAFIGYINYEAFLTGKLKANANFSRSISPFEQSNSTYSLTDALSGELTYAITEKIQASINARVSERDFDGRGQFSTGNRSDNEHAFGASLSWKPVKTVGVSLTSTKSNRNSTLSQFDFDDTLTSVNVELKL